LSCTWTEPGQVWDAGIGTDKTYINQERL